MVDIASQLINLALQTIKFLSLGFRKLLELLIRAGHFPAEASTVDSRSWPAKGPAARTRITVGRSPTRLASRSA
jgi:hypothetical protein